MKASTPTTEPTADELRAVADGAKKHAADSQRIRDIRRWLLENECQRCGSQMEPADAYRAEPDVGITAFAGGHRCTDCGLEVED